MVLICRQPFYRQLAAGADVEARKEAAERLAEGMASDRVDNLPILRGLLGDSDMSVRAAATVSLLLLGEKDVEKQIVTWLKSPDLGERNATLYQLLRVADGRSLIFARDALRALSTQVQDRQFEKQRVQQLLERIAGAE